MVPIMRIRVLSDLHIDFGGGPQPADCGEDVVVLAGDICEGVAGLEWAVTAFPRTPIVFVPGNHEYYEAEMDPLLAQLREAAERLAPGRLRVLDREGVVIDGVRFLGATLWTDYRLFGGTDADAERAMAYSHSRLLDYRRILVPDGAGDGDAGVRFLTPADTVALHRPARQFITLALASGDPRATVVVTHHGPHPRSVAPLFADDLTSAGFISDLGRLMGRAAVWIHGHTHVSFDYTVNGTRVVCNPRGYCSPDGAKCENPDFRWDKVVEL